MDKERISKIVEALDGIKKYEWEQLKPYVDRAFNPQIRRVELNDPNGLKKALEAHFIQ